jgi:KUP system potassium uptake protein
LGIVYGDIGTSPLYAMDQLFFGRASAPTTEEVLGGVSLVIWTITIIVAVKYAILVLRAQNDGEGGLFALYGLLHELKKRGTRPLLWALMLGAGLLFGDGIITPAISVVSAVEGLQVATPSLSNAVVPITIGLLTVLFAIQYKGTSGIGIVFGPIPSGLSSSPGLASGKSGCARRYSRPSIRFMVLRFFDTPVRSMPCSS